MEPLSNGQVGTRPFVCCLEVVLYLGVLCQQQQAASSLLECVAQRLSEGHYTTLDRLHMHSPLQTDTDNVLSTAKKQHPYL